MKYAIIALLAAAALAACSDHSTAPLGVIVPVPPTATARPTPTPTAKPTPTPAPTCTPGESKECE